MRALVFTEPGQMELMDVPEPSAGGDEAVVEVHAAGICGSELHGFRSAGFRKPPLVMGHEFAGTTPDGQRVAVNPLQGCGHCPACGSGAPQLCPRRTLLGIHRAGAFAERVCVPAAALNPIPADMPWEVAGMIEPLANAVHAWKLAGNIGHRRVAIIGAGTIGLVCLLQARRSGADGVTVVDRSSHRLRIAKKLGAAACATALSGEYDVVLDAVGAATTRRDAVACLRPGGSAIWIGLAAADPGFDSADLIRWEKRVVGSFAYTPEEFGSAVSLAPELDLSWVTPIGLEDSRRVFMSLADGADDPIKAIIRR